MRLFNIEPPQIKNAEPAFSLISRVLYLLGQIWCFLCSRHRCRKIFKVGGLNIQLHAKCARKFYDHAHFVSNHAHAASWCFAGVEEWVAILERANQDMKPPHQP